MAIYSKLLVCSKRQRPQFWVFDMSMSNSVPKSSSYQFNEKNIYYMITSLVLYLSKC
jgi:hypothetical protein